MDAEKESFELEINVDGRDKYSTRINTKMDVVELNALIGRLKRVRSVLSVSDDVTDSIPRRRGSKRIWSTEQEKVIGEGIKAKKKMIAIYRDLFGDVDVDNNMYKRLAYKIGNMKKNRN